jgi:hypothetical protein
VQMDPSLTAQSAVLSEFLQLVEIFLAKFLINISQTQMFIINPLAPDFFLILAHPVYKM